MSETKLAELIGACETNPNENETKLVNIPTFATG